MRSEQNFERFEVL